MEVEKLTTEEKIIDASFKVLKNDGISKITTKKIAQTAGVSEVTIFRKFKTKENLLKIAKKHYLDNLLSKLDETFDFDEDITTEEYLKASFNKAVKLSEIELNMFKIAMEEVIYVKSAEKVIPIISTKIIDKLTEYFKLQIGKNRIRPVNPNVLAITVYGIIFESIILWKVFGQTPKEDIDFYADDFLDILLNGIQTEVNNDRKKHVRTN